MAFFISNVWLACALLASWSACQAAFAQDEAPLRRTGPQVPAPNNKTAQPPEMERLLDALSGAWTTVDTYKESDQAPGARRERSRVSYRVGPARLSLIEEYHGENDPGKTWATGIFWWDHEASGVHILWCDSEAIDMGCRVLRGIGKWQGDVFVLTDQREEFGKQVYTKEVWSNFKRDSFTQTVYQGRSADKLEKVLTIKATRSTSVADH